MQKITLNTHIVLKHPVILQDEIEDLFTIVNPEYKSICQQRKLSKAKQPKGYIVTRFKKDNKWKSKKVPQYLRYYSINKKDILIPRGAFFELKKLYKKHNIKYKLTDKRNIFEKQNFKFQKELDPERGQLPILDYNAKNGILKSGTGSGKTAMGLFTATKINIPILIVIDTFELMNQWKREINFFLGIKKSDIGQIGDGIEVIRPITVALYQTLKKRLDLLDKFGFLIIDECEIVATDSYGLIINSFNGPNVMGLSATPKRKDGKTKVMKWYIGPIKLKIRNENSIKTPCIATFIGTDYKGKLSFANRSTYTKAIVALTEDQDRNKLIIKNVLNNIDFFGVHLILSSSSKHLKILMKLLPDYILLISRLLIGPVKKEERVEIIKLMSLNKIKFIFTTMALFKKGIDEELLTVAHLTTPIKDPEQPVGRIRRIPKTDKIKELKTMSLVFDYFDKYENVLRNHASKRSKVYRKLGIEKRIN